ncbi:MAG: trigger factor [bacterium]|nr:trigger factor [bacterium]
MSENTQQPSGPIRTTVESPAPCLRVIKAEVDREVYDQEYAGRLRKAVKGHQKPGFRKGRTPKAVVEREMGDLLRAETIEALVPKVWMTALVEHRLQPLTDPSLANFKFEDEGPLSFDLSVEVKPEIEVQGYEGLPVKQREAVVDDAEVEEFMDRLRESRAVFDQVDRAAADGDRITLDLTPGKLGEEDEEPKTIEGEQFVLGAETNMPAFNAELTGAGAGDERDVEVAYPAEHPNEKLRGQTITFHCVIKEVATKVLPEADDAFATQVAEGKTMLELRTDIRQDLEKEAGRRVASEVDQQLITELVARNDVPLPPSMVEKYLDQGIEEMKRRQAQQTGTEPGPEQIEQYRTDGRPHAEKSLAAMLLMEAVRKQEDIKVRPEDVDERIGEMAGEHGFEVDRFREFVKSGDEMERIEYDLLERRTYDFLLSRAEVEQVPADTDVLKDKE